MSADDYIFRPASWSLPTRAHSRWTLVRKGRRIVAKLKRARSPWRLVTLIDPPLFSEPGYTLMVKL